ncbi:MAG: molybdopterin-binding protein [Coprothermobacterota bacterium]|nr:molybdopterin-binding protein [Coprothermobacterota bacterium]
MEEKIDLETKQLNGKALPHGTIAAVNCSQRKGTRKKEIREGLLVAEFGLKGDAHAGPWHRQVSLLAEESIAKMRCRGIELDFGDFAENLTTRGLDLPELPVGTQLALGTDVLLEVTQIGKECHQSCEIRRLVGDCVMPREGIFARVLSGGTVRAGDPIRVLEKPELSFKETSLGCIRRAAVLTLSDRCAKGEQADLSGPFIADGLRQAGWEIRQQLILPDDLEAISGQLVAWCDQDDLDLILTTGGTGFGPRDNTPEATLAILQRRAPGLAEALRSDGMKRTPTACLSRGEAGLRGKTLVVNLPGSLRAVQEGMSFLVPLLDHALVMMRGGGH